MEPGAQQPIKLRRQIAAVSYTHLDVYKRQVTVALLHAMWTYLGVLPTRQQLAAAAVQVERDILGRPIGVQDQYAAAFGGLRFHRFGPQGVSSEAVLPDEAATEQLARRLGERLLIFFTGITRQSASVLAEQRANIEAHRPLLRTMARQAHEGRQALVEGRLAVSYTHLDVYKRQRWSRADPRR